MKFWGRVESNEFNWPYGGGTIQPVRNVGLLKMKVQLFERDALCKIISGCFVLYFERESVRASR